MGAGDDLDDDYVAKLLAEDAKKTSARYRNQGLSALLPSKARSADAPRPNTRFLTHVVREADQHNAALKKREEVEARARLDELKRGRVEDRRVRRADESGSRKRQRLLQDLSEAARSRGHTGDGERDRSDGRLSKRSSKSTHQSSSTRHRDRSRSRSPARKHKDKSRLSRSEASEEYASRSDERRKRRRSSAYDSDPLDDYLKGSVKSAPSAPTRGRGAYNRNLDGASEMDKHFSKDYDPSADVNASEGSVDDDWDMALEALRDRAKWKQNQKSRLREAGFDDAQIERWESGKGVAEVEADGDVRDVKWVGKGERREWDVGKANA